MVIQRLPASRSPASCPPAINREGRHRAFPAVARLWQGRAGGFLLEGTRTAFRMILGAGQETPHRWNLREVPPTSGPQDAGTSRFNVPLKAAPSPRPIFNEIEDGLAPRGCTLGDPAPGGGGGGAATHSRISVAGRPGALPGSSRFAGALSMLPSPVIVDHDGARRASSRGSAWVTACRRARIATLTLLPVVSVNTGGARLPLRWAPTATDRGARFLSCRRRVLSAPPFIA